MDPSHPYRQQPPELFSLRRVLVNPWFPVAVIFAVVGLFLVWELTK